MLFDETVPATNRILILNYGSQYAHLISRRCRECSVYAQTMPYNVELEIIRKYDPVGVILSGGPASVYEKGAPRVSPAFWDYIEESNLPVLAICYGFQDAHLHYGGVVQSADIAEYGSKELYLTPESTHDALFQDVSCVTTVWMSHRDAVIQPSSLSVLMAKTDSCKIGATTFRNKHIWGLQFHPEVYHTREGRQIFSNFFHKICKIPIGFWTMHNFKFAEIQRLHKRIGHRHVIGAISGGVDSLVAAALVYRAIGKQFNGFLVDTGLLRKGEAKQVIEYINKELCGMKVSVIDASELFFSKLKGVTDPEQKRNIIGSLFIEVFLKAVDELKQDKENAALYDDAFLLQGTICTDVIESAEAQCGAAGLILQKIKTHHNVGGLPSDMKLELLEPLRTLFKDEVRTLGLELSISPNVLRRHPFPGPGLAVRILGEVTRERVAILQQADEIFTEELIASNYYETASQAFAVLLPTCQTVGVTGDSRTYGMTIALRAIASTDFMTAEACEIPISVLKKCASRIHNEVHHVNRVCYDVTSKPPSTIEWE